MNLKAKIKLGARKFVFAAAFSLAVCVLFPADGFAASKFDDLVDKITTKTMINHVTNSKGKVCGAPDDDYAQKWRYAFRRQQYNDHDYHADAVKSLEAALSSPDGAVAVAYEQVDTGFGGKSPYLAKVYWTEHDRADFEMAFMEIVDNGVKPVIGIRARSGSSKKMHVATIASPSTVQGGSACIPEFLWGYTASNTSATWFKGQSDSHKLLFSTFDVTYPDGYEGSPIPSVDPARDWHPTSSHYDDLMEKITTDKLVNYVDNYYKTTCGSPTNDYSNSWLSAVGSQDKYYARSYHGEYVKSLRRAMVNGAYAIGYSQKNNHDNSSNPYFFTIFWAESRDGFRMRFLQEYPERRLYIQRNRGSTDEMYVATVGSPALILGGGDCSARFLFKNSFEIPVFEEGSDFKLFKSTFDVEYPDGYRGTKVPGGVEKLDYIALGDSYSSGEGDTEKNSATNKKYYRYPTDENEDKSIDSPREKCHISTRSYPYKLARQMGLSQAGAKQWESVACSGATIYDLNGENSGGYDGQNGRLNGFSDKSTLRGMALNEMIPGRVKQIEFVKKYQPKVITLTAGGNDVGFGDKIKSCIHPKDSLGTCDWAKDEKDTLGSQIRGQFNRLVSLYKELKTASPGAKIYAIGYPQFITDAESAVCKLNAGAVNLDERRMIVQATQYMNEVVEAAARKAGVKYVDISRALDGGKLCENYQIYMTGIVGLGTQESYHPNHRGHLAIYLEIAKQLDHEDLSTYSKYPVAGDESVAAPLTIHFDKGAASSINAAMVANVNPSKGSEQRIALAKGVLQPGSSVRVEIRSDPVALGNYNVSEDGSLQGMITIPDSLPVGYHTLFVYGKSANGENVKITQTLLVTGKDAEDLDDDGVKDKDQPCGAFLKASGKDEDLDGIDDACDSEITEPILYSARNGDPELGEDEDRIYLFRNTRAAELTGIANDYADISKDPDNKQALIGATLDDDVRGLMFDKLVMAEEGNDEITKNTPIILAKDVSEKCYALKPEDHLSPALNPHDKDYKPRKLIKLTNLPKGVKCEE